jgi:hypothetical protein
VKTSKALSLTAVALFVMLGCKNSNLKNEKVLFENDGNICVISGSGKAQTIVASKLNRTKDRYGIDCFDLNTQPFYSSTKKEVVFVKKVNSLKNGGASELDRIGKFQIVNYQIENDKSFVLFEIPDYRFGALISPIYVNDSKTVAFLYGKNLVLVDAEGKSKPTTVCEIPNNIDLAEGDYIREGGGNIYAVVGSSEKKGELLLTVENVWEVNLVKKKASLIKNGELYFDDNGYIKVDEVVKYLPENVRRICFGSIEHPVLEPVESNNGDYYFWDERREGFMAKRFIAAYDRANGKIINMHTVWWHIYYE